MSIIHVLSDHSTIEAKYICTYFEAKAKNVGNMYDNSICTQLVT